MKILVASSGRSEEGGDPVATVASFPWPADAEIHVLSVAEVAQPVMVGMGADGVDLTDLQVTSREEAQALANDDAKRLRSRGLHVEGITVEGVPETAIVDYAKYWGADLIVVGSRDHSLLERLLLGSTSQGVVKHAPCSVLVAKHKAAV